MPLDVGGASAGTLVGAVLETVGYHYQSYILDEMKSAFEGSLGMFIYLVGVVVALFAIAIRGGFRFAPWLLIGPPLFFSAVIPRDSVNFVRWQYAKQDRDNARAEEEMQRVLNQQANGARVSRLFAKYTVLVSNTVQEMVRIINREKTDTDKWFIIRAQMLSRIYARNAANTGLQQMIEDSLFRDCGRKVAAAKIYGDHTLTPSQKKRSEEELNLRERFELSTPSLLYVSDLRKALDLHSQPVDADGNPTGPPIKLEQDPKKIKDERFTCEDVWYYVYEGLKREGYYTAMSVRDDVSRNGINVAKALDQLARALGLVDAGAPNVGTADEGRLIELLSYAAGKYILRNESGRNSFAGRLEETAGLTQEYSNVEAPLENALAQTELARARSTEWAEKTRLMTAASNLPYYQGLLLYFLSVAFPFFALLLLVPGKHGGFIMWFILWLWVKSWDVAMAVVYQLDDVLFSLLSLSKEVRKDERLTEQLNVKFEIAMNALRESDPTFQMTTYYNILGACLAAIPVVTSMVILGSMSGGAGLVAAGMKGISDDLSAGAERAQSQAAISGVRHQHQQLAMARMTMYFRNRVGLSDFRTDPNTGRPYRDRYQFTPLAGQTGAGTERFAASIEPQHIVYGPSPNGNPRQTASNRYGDTAGFTLADKQAVALVLKRIQGMAKAMDRPEGMASLRKMFIGEGGTPQGWDKLIRDLSGAMGGGVEQTAGALANYLSTTMNAETASVAAWAMFDSNYSERGKQLAAYARIYTQLEVPWTADTGELAESDMELEFRKAQQQLEADFVEAFGSLGEKGWGAGQTYFTK